MKRFLRRRAARDGMVLFELMIAMTIFILVVFGLVTALDRAFTIAGERTRIDEAVRGLRNQLALVRGGSVQLVPGELDLPGDGTDIAYHVAVVPEPAFDNRKQPILGLMRVTLTARWSAGNDTDSRSLSTLFYRP